LKRAIELHAQWLAGPADRRQFLQRYAGRQLGFRYDHYTLLAMTYCKITKPALRGKGA
jgi:hypothetical protein